MRIHAVRFGHANNSSSTHSIVLLDPDHGERTDEWTDFGWDYFTAASKEAKDNYAALTLRSAIGKLVDPMLRYDDGVGLTLDQQVIRLGGAAPKGYIDHQSIITLPRPRSGQPVDVDFWKAWRDDLLRDGVVVLGGNDNTTGEDGYTRQLHDLDNPDNRLYTELPREGRQLVSRHDVDGPHDWWVLYDPESGNRTRVTFEDNTIGPSSPAPELVDIKVTDACPFETDCGFCFSGDTEYLTIDGPRTFTATVGTVQRVLVSTGITGDTETMRPRPRFGDFGGEWREAEIRSFGVQPLMKVTLRRHTKTKVVFATPEHRWLVTSKRGGKKSARRIVRTEDLVPGLPLASLYPRRAIFQGPTPTTPSPVGIAAGMVFGDGTLDGRGGSRIDLWGEKDAALLPYFPQAPGSARSTVTSASGATAVVVRHLPAFFKSPPPLGESASYLYGWLAGYFAADGAINPEYGSPFIDSARRENLELVQSICNRLGIGTYGISEYERTGFGDESGMMYRIRLVGKTLTPEFFVGASHRQRFMDRYEAMVSPPSWTVVSVEPTDREEEVFCAVVPGNQNFTLAGNINVMNCYQGSTRDGAHAVERDVEQVVTALGKMGVYEIAFGGGEPTLWPGFWKILRHARQQGITPNFTTKNLGWLGNAEAVAAVVAHAGSFAVSVNSVAEIDQAVGRLVESGFTKAFQTDRISLQLIPAVAGPDVVAHALAVSREKWFNVTLLGYKTTGRGNLFDAPHAGVVLWLPELLADPANGRSVGIDTTLAVQLGDRLEELTPKWTFETREGIRSCYIDAVAMTIDASSYTGREGRPIPRHPEHGWVTMKDLVPVWDEIRHEAEEAPVGAAPVFDPAVALDTYLAVSDDGRLGGKIVGVAQETVAAIAEYATNNGWAVYGVTDPITVIVRQDDATTFTFLDKTGR